MKVLRKKAVRAMFGDVSGMTIDRWEKAGKFPKRIKLGENSVGWIQEECEAELTRRMAQRDGARDAAV